MSTASRNRTTRRAWGTSSRSTIASMSPRSSAWKRFSYSRMSVTSASQGFGEVFGLQARRDTPLPGERRPGRDDVIQGLLAADARVDDVERHRLVRVLGRDEREKRLEDDGRPCIELLPRRRSGRRLATDGLERIGGDPAYGSTMAIDPGRPRPRQGSWPRSPWWAWRTTMGRHGDDEDRPWRSPRFTTALSSRTATTARRGGSLASPAGDPVGTLPPSGAIDECAGESLSDSRCFDATRWHPVAWSVTKASEECLSGNARSRLNPNSGRRGASGHRNGNPNAGGGPWHSRVQSGQLPSRPRAFPSRRRRAPERMSRSRTRHRRRPSRRRRRRHRPTCLTPSGRPGRRWTDRGFTSTTLVSRSRGRSWG